MPQPRHSTSTGGWQTQHAATTTVEGERRQCQLHARSLAAPTHTLQGLRPHKLHSPGHGLFVVVIALKAIRIGRHVTQVVEIVSCGHTRIVRCIGGGQTLTGRRCAIW